YRRFPSRRRHQDLTPLLQHARRDRQPVCRDGADRRAQGLCRRRAGANVRDVTTVEIHAPHRAVASLKEALVHLVLITAGVLIALSFEGIAGWREHRALVHEARVNLASEIRDNMNELGHRLKNIPTERPPSRRRRYGEPRRSFSGGGSRAYGLRLSRGVRRSPA